MSDGPRTFWAAELARTPKGRQCEDCGALHTRRSPRCEPCARARHLQMMRDWHAKHRDEVNPKRREHYAAHREERAEYDAARWRRIHRPKVRTCRAPWCDKQFEIGQCQGKKLYCSRECFRTHWYEQNRTMILAKKRRGRPSRAVRATAPELAPELAPKPRPSRARPPGEPKPKRGRPLGSITGPAIPREAQHKAALMLIDGRSYNEVAAAVGCTYEQARTVKRNLLTFADCTIVQTGSRDERG